MARKKLLENAEVVPDSLQIEKEKEKEEESPPLPTSPEWSDFVMTHFLEDELVEGRPKVAGLRRVAELLLGRIIVSKSSVVSCEQDKNGARCAVVEHTISLERWVGEELIPIIYQDVASVNHDNCEPAFLCYDVATAATRAEGRALRKALKLKTITAEEAKGKAANTHVEEAPRTISSTQVNTLDIKCRQLNINLLSFVNMGENQYKDIMDIPFDKAIGMIKVLNQYQQEVKPIPDKIRGYQAWR